MMMTNRCLCSRYKLYPILMDQMRTFSMGETDSQIAQILIGSIDDWDISEGVANIVDDLAFTENICGRKSRAKVLKKVQQLDPAGWCIGLARVFGTSAATPSQSPEVSLTYNIIKFHFTPFSKAF